MSRNIDFDHLFSQIIFYQHIPRLKEDIRQLLANIRTLRPQINKFQNEGQTITLFFLSGTLPIHYNTVQYNIPMTVYFDPPYPTSPPRCFVSPTPGMSIKPRHKHVDANGMIYLPYLNQWNSRTSNLTELLTVLSSTFSTDPPVFATPGGGSTNSGNTQKQKPVAAGASGAATTASIPHGQSRRSNKGYVPTAAPSRRIQRDEPDIEEVVEPQDPAVVKRLEMLKALNASCHTILTDNVRKRMKCVEDELELQEKLQQHEMEVDQLSGETEKSIEKMKLDTEELAAVTVSVNEWLETNAQTEFDADRVTEPNDEIMRQLLDVIASDAAYTDVLSLLDDCHREGKISLDEHLRYVREYSRKQFFERALRRKIICVIRASKLKSANIGSPTAGN